MCQRQSPVHSIFSIFKYFYSITRLELSFQARTEGWGWTGWGEWAEDACPEVCGRRCRLRQRACGGPYEVACKNKGRAYQVGEKKKKSCCCCCCCCCCPGCCRSRTVVVVVVVVVVVAAAAAAAVAAAVVVSFYSLLFLAVQNPVFLTFYRCKILLVFIFLFAIAFCCYLSV